MAVNVRRVKSSTSAGLQLHLTVDGPARVHAVGAETEVLAADITDKCSERILDSNQPGAACPKRAC
jgi:hypothetical protein